MNWRRVLPLFLGAMALFLVACLPKDTADDANSGPVGPARVKAERAQCEAQGGSFARAGLAQALTCVKPTGDANRSCSSGAQCEGYCLARSGTCAPVSPLFGCNDILTDRGARATICID